MLTKFQSRNFYGTPFLLPNTNSKFYLNFFLFFLLLPTLELTNVFFFLKKKYCNFAEHYLGWTIGSILWVCSFWMYWIRWIQTFCTDFSKPRQHLVRAKSQTDCRLATSHPSTYLIDLEIPTRISYLKRMLKTFPPTTLSHNGPTGIYSLLLISLIPSEFIVKLHKRTILLVILRDNSLPTAYPSYPDDLTSLACSNKSLIVF